jgi:hypothetical protein
MSFHVGMAQLAFPGLLAGVISFYILYHKGMNESSISMNTPPVFMVSKVFSFIVLKAMVDDNISSSVSSII